MLDCNYECTEKKKKKKEPKKPVEIVGPVKILVVEETPVDYIRKIYEAAFIMLSYVFMGAAVTTVLYFTLVYNTHWTLNVHIVLNTLACQFCIICAFLLHNDANLPSIPMNKGTKDFQYSAMVIFAFLLFLFANCMMYTLYHPYFKVTRSSHPVMGTCNFVFMVIYIPTLAMNFVKILKPYFFISKILAIFALIFSALAYTTGVNEPAIKMFLPHRHCGAIVTFFCAFYTLFVIKNLVWEIIRDVKQFIKK